ncbi:hypothetical protein H8S90_04000 [Olivibacter sp. SDN3]|uniref:DUF5695 domain-containing protein n=1 Tax=Olivibacter sp. SDN3 TaxID=2764720 RepID=UPI001650D987|nr:DUF5695 domain-containing protein [Olivibacter sp. SDN3]QNL50767.1 hypothetical protein H8S90_04000 [Olivibacter sp. SDN3]
MKIIRKIALLLSLLCSLYPSFAQNNPWELLAKRPKTLGISQGVESFLTTAFELKLVKESQTVAALHLRQDHGFDFTPGDRLAIREGDSLYHLGDINLRLRPVGNAEWQKFSTASQRKPIKILSASGNTLAAADLSNTLNATMPLQITRYWENIDGKLVLRFELQNRSEEIIEIGALGIPMIFNNILQERTLDEAHAQNVFFDPYIGKDAGYLQVAKLSGTGQALLVLPYGKTPFEAYRPLLDDPTPRGITFEGFHEWMVHSKAYAEQEWKGVEQWNEPTSLLLKPHEQVSYGIRFVLADDIKQIEQSLEANYRPVATGFPGYVLPEDVEAKLFLKYQRLVQSIEVHPKDALKLEEISGNTQQAYQVTGKKWGRARLTITYEDGLVQTIHYKIIKSESELVADMGRFYTNEQWFDEPSDVFKRSPSVISYDHETKQQVTQDNRAWVAGLSDEGGAGSWLAAIMKQLVQPDKEELEKLQKFVHQTLWGNIQHKEGPQKYGVKKSVFYYEPDSMPAGTYDTEINWEIWSAWNKKGADDVGRSYNYPHVTAAHWVLYRLARNYQGLVTQENWRWYLEKAFHTGMAMVKQAPHYAQFGQMEGTIFLMVLMDLKAEGFHQMAEELERSMKARADHWRSLNYPFGSEMPWDSTGQEEVYMWSDYFGYDDKAKVTLNAILAYMPTVPHWAYNGNAHRYWDFLYGGKISRVERQIHHYGSALNAIPVLKNYRDHLDDLYLLRVGYGGLLGGIANVTQDGFGPCAFHSFPSTLANDALSGDYGSGFFGYAVNTSSYLVQDTTFGWLGFGANLKETEEWITLTPTTAAKSRVFIAPAKLWLTLDAGQFTAIAYHKQSKNVRIKLAEKSDFLPRAFLRIDHENNAYTLPDQQQTDRGAYAIALADDDTVVELNHFSH